jgi:hypothetical protein
MSDHYIHSFVRDPARAYGIVSKDDGYSSSSLKKGDTFQVQYRGKIYQCADWLGYVPVLGTAVGIARMAVSITTLGACLLSGIGMVFVYAHSYDDKTKFYDEWRTRVSVICMRSRDEFLRGLGEIIPIFNWLLEAAEYEDTVRSRCTFNSHRAAGPVYYVKENGDVVYPYMEYDVFNDRYDSNLKEQFEGMPSAPVLAVAVELKEEDECLSGYSNDSVVSN